MAKRKNITRRWLVYGFSMIAVVLLIAAMVVLAVMSSYYYQGVREAVSVRADVYRQSMSAAVDTTQWNTAALRYVENFNNKEQMELQVLSANGTLLASSTGFVPNDTRAARDFALASQHAKGRISRSGFTASGEHVMALTVIEKNTAGVAVGALRFVVTLRLVDRQLLLLSLLILAVVLLILFFTALSGLYFIRSIVHPVEEIGRAAQRIATGDYAYRVEKHSQDEIGDLCDTINYMASEIQRTESLKNEFISSVSHELRTPLTAIRGWSETIQQMGSTDSEMTARGMQIIAEETDRLSAMVEELLDFSRMQSGKMELRFTALQVTAVLEETVFLFRDRAEKKGVHIHYVGEGEMPLISADADRLRQVFINVLDNAIKYSDAGDTVRVDYAVVDSGIQIVIGDTGNGIAAKDLSQVKHKFYKGNTTRPGSGIGLAVADEIIKGHGGTLELHSKEGVGTSVIITLPEVTV